MTTPSRLGTNASLRAFAWIVLVASASVFGVEACGSGSNSANGADAGPDDAGGPPTEGGPSVDGGFDGGNDGAAVTCGEFGMGALDEVPAAYFRSAPAIAQGTAKTLIVWTDERRTVQEELYAMLVPNDHPLAPGRGFLLREPSKIFVGGASSYPPGFAPHVAFGGGVFLVIAQNDRRSGSLFATRVSEDGTILSPSEVDLGSATDSAVTFDGQRFIVSRSYNGKIYSRSMTADGVLSPDVVWDDGDAGGSGGASSPTLASAAGTTVLAWETNYGVRVARLGPSLDVADPSYASTPPTSSVPLHYLSPAAIATDGTGFAVVWADSSGVLGRGLDATGKPAGQPTAIVQGDHPSTVAASADATAMTFVWDGVKGATASTVLRSATFSRDGVVGNVHLLQVATAGGTDAARDPLLGVLGGQPFVMWTDTTSSIQDLFFDPLGADGTLADPYGTRLATALPTQSGRFVTIGDKPFIAFTERLDTSKSGSRTLAQPLTATGAFAGPPIPFSAFPSVSGSSGLALGYADDATNGGYPTASRVGSSGALLDATPIRLDQDWQHVGVFEMGGARDGDDFFVVWAGNPTVNGSVGGVAVSSTGNVVEASRVALRGKDDGDVRFPVTACGAGVCAVAWERVKAPDYVDFAVVDHHGAIVGQGEVEPESGAPNSRRLAFDGTNFVLSWQVASNVAGASPLRTVRISPAGAMIGSPITVGGTDVAYAGLACSGGRTTFAWSEAAGGLHTRSFGADGTALGPDRLVATAYPDVRDVDVAFAANGGAFALIQRFDIPSGAARVYSLSLDDACK